MRHIAGEMPDNWNNCKTIYTNDIYMRSWMSVMSARSLRAERPERLVMSWGTQKVIWTYGQCKYTQGKKGWGYDIIWAGCLDGVGWKMRVEMGWLLDCWTVIEGAVSI